MAMAQRRNSTCSITKIPATTAPAIIADHPSFQDSGPDGDDRIRTYNAPRNTSTRSNAASTTCRVTKPYTAIAAPITVKRTKYFVSMNYSLFRLYRQYLMVWNDNPADR